MRPILFDKQGRLRGGWKLLRIGMVTTGFVFILAFMFKLSTGEGKVPSWVIPVSIIFAVLFCMRWFDGIKLKEIGVTWNRLPHVLYGAFLGTASAVLLGLYLVLTGELSSDFWTNPDSLWKKLALCICVGIGEELLFRGYLLRLLQQSYNTIWAVVISSLLFVLIHAVNPQYDLKAYLFAGLAALLLIYMLFRTGSLWLSIGFHISWNYVQELFQYPYTGGLIGNVIIILLNFLVVWFWTKGRASNGNVLRLPSH